MTNITAKLLEGFTPERDGVVTFYSPLVVIDASGLHDLGPASLARTELLVLAGQQLKLDPDSLRLMLNDEDVACFRADDHVGFLSTPRH